MTPEDAVQQTIDPNERVLSEFEGGRLIAARGDVGEWFRVDLQYREDGRLLVRRFESYDMATLLVSVWLSASESGFPTEHVGNDEWVPRDVARAGKPVLAGYLRTVRGWDVGDVGAYLGVTDQTVYQYGTRVRSWNSGLFPEVDE